MIKNKKGVFFTLLVLLILTLFLISFVFVSEFQKRKVVQKRIETMNSFLFTVEEDLQRKMFISGFRTIFLLNKHIVESGSFISSSNESFQEAFFNGTIEGTTNVEIQQLMEGITFSEVETSLNEIARDINVELNLSSPSLEVMQDNPWSIKLVLKTNLSLRDKSDLASWNRREEISADIPIIGFEDPLYILNTNGSFPNAINQTPYSIIDDSNIEDHATNSYYINSTTAPSFIDRLEGNKLSESQQGIESLVSVTDLPIQYQKSKSIVDHVYFSLNNPSACQISGQPGWIRLDNAHIGSPYQVSCV